MIYPSVFEDCPSSVWQGILKYDIGRDADDTRSTAHTFLINCDFLSERKCIIQIRNSLKGSSCNGQYQVTRACDKFQWSWLIVYNNCSLAHLHVAAHLDDYDNLVHLDLPWKHTCTVCSLYSIFRSWHYYMQRRCCAVQCGLQPSASMHRFSDCLKSSMIAHGITTVHLIDYWSQQKLPWKLP